MSAPNSPVASIPSPLDHKQVRYDRQLRLWGDHGQKALENAHVCLLNATATGTETLKSLVLPGIGSFTIIDGTKTTGQDTGSNFFLDSEHIGKPRAEVACNLLKEMNPQVNGNWILESCSQLLDNNISILDKFSIVIATDLSEKLAILIGDYLWERDVPFIICRSYGMLAYLRVSVREHTVVESHPENRFHDMRMDRVFPELAAFTDSIDLDALNHKDHSHTPYLVILMKALEKFREMKENKDAFPIKYSDKKELKKILAGMRKPDEKGRDDEENVQEAIDSLNLALHKTEVPCEIHKIINDPSACDLSTESTPFWLLCNGLKRFVDEEGVLPVRGTLPDMTADSARYVQLQDIFHQKAKSDALKVYNFVQTQLHSLSLPSSTVTMNQTLLFCKNASFLRVIRGRSLRQEITDDSQPAISVVESNDAHFAWYVMLRATERFYAEKGRYPGTNGIPIVLDKNDLRNRVQTLLKEWNCEKYDAPDKMVEEMCRYGASEIHPVASILGGIAAQTAIKLVTKQYVPVDNTYIFDAHTSNGGVYKL